MSPKRSTGNTGEMTSLYVRRRATREEMEQGQDEMRRAQERLERERIEENVLAVEDASDAVVPVNAETTEVTQRETASGSVEVETERPAILDHATETGRTIEALTEGPQETALSPVEQSQVTPGSRPPLQQPVTPVVPKSYAPQTPTPGSAAVGVVSQDRRQEQAVLSNGGAHGLEGTGGRSRSEISQQNTPVQPLFDQQQLMRLQELAVPQGTLLYPALGAHTMTFQQAPPLQRPLFLEGEEMRTQFAGAYVQRPVFLEGGPVNAAPPLQDQQQVQQQPAAEAVLSAQAQDLTMLVQTLVHENEKLRGRIQALEVKKGEENQLFTTPTGSEKLKEGTGSPKEAETTTAPNGLAKEAVRPPSKEAETPLARPFLATVMEVEAPRSSAEAPRSSAEALRSSVEAPRSSVEFHPGPKEAARPPSQEAEVPPVNGLGPFHRSAPKPEDWSRPKEAETPKDQDREDQKAAFQVMLRLMEGMQAMQKQLLEGRDDDREGQSEYVRGSPALPPLAEWNPSTAPIDLNDWLALIEPIMSDLTHSSGEWWNQLMEEASKWYQDHLQLQPLERMAHLAVPSAVLTKAKWTRLEKRASTLLLMALPEPQREELIASKKLSALSIVCQLLVSYKPGGLAEKELILRSLEVPPEAGSLTEAIQALRRWSRWRRRAAELRISEPDPYLLLKGLNRIIKKPLENNRELTFRISLARSMLQVNSTPSSTSVTSFAQHLLAEFEQIAHQEAGSTSSKKKQQEAEKKMNKLKKLEEEGGSPTGKTRERSEGDRPKCKFYLSDNGCKRGKSCTFSHDQKDDKRRCWTCGSPEHMAPACPRSKGTKDGSPTGKGKIMKAEGEESSQGSREKEEDSSQEPAQSMKELLTQANSMLKTLSTPTQATTVTTSSTNSSESREDMLEKLQQQINALKLKVFKIYRINCGSQQGLVDSGATHPLRPIRFGEKANSYQRVSVTLANGQSTSLQMTPGGIMVSEQKDVEPIIPMGHMTGQLGCTMMWKEDGMKITHPLRGDLPVTVVNGCPQLPRSVTLDLIEELEQLGIQSPSKQRKFQEEVQWMHQLVESHPVLRDLPDRIRSKLVIQPGDWSALPANKRVRKRLQRDGFLLHLYAGEDSGFTLSRAFKQVGGDPTRLLEVDIKRGASHDMLVDGPNGIYAGLLRAVMDDKIIAIVGGPNCRSRSVLRHRPIPGVPDAPRPLRFWNGQEHGREDLTPQESQLLQEDDVLLWRMIFLHMVGTYLRNAKGVCHEIGFGLEQPASPKAYQPETVSLWDTEEWKAVAQEFGFQETTFNQGALGGPVPKPTTMSGNLDFCISKHKMDQSLNHDPVKNSKELARWSPGLMNMVAEALFTKVHSETIKLCPLSWEEHVRHGHVPFRRDCLVCQQSLQQQPPHRRVEVPLGGVLSLDTSGPLKQAQDLGSYKVKYLLVGALTWAVPKESDKLKEPEVEEPPEGAPEIEEVQEEQEEEGQEVIEDQEPEADQLLEVLQEVNEEEAVEERPEEEEKEDEVEEKKEVEIRVFRLVAPMISKKSKVVTKHTMEMLLRLRADGFHVAKIHSDQGHEFQGYFRNWRRERGILLSKTSGDDPRANGRAECAVRSIKCQIRRALLQAEVGPEWWPWAARYVNELNRAARIHSPQTFPTFLAKVLVRKRKWKQGVFESSLETVRYLTPSPQDHGHYVVKDDEAPRLTKLLVKEARFPKTEAQWIAIEQETVDELVKRRRLREKVAVRSFEVQTSEEEGKKERQERRLKVLELVEDEMRRMVGDPIEAIEEEMKILVKLKKMAEEELTEEEEILQTKIVSPKEVAAQWQQWLPSVIQEVESLLYEKEAFSVISDEELERWKKEEREGGRKLEFIPSKAVFTRKPGPSGGKKKTRWVVCGNFEEVKPSEQTFSSGADSVALRILVWVAAWCQWSAATTDVRTAFLNAKMIQPENENRLIVKPPWLFVEKGYLPKNRYYHPDRAVYGFRRSPRLWGITRDDEIQGFEIEVEEGGEKMKFRLVPLQSEPNLWKLVNAINEEDETVYGLLLTYVDDLLLASTQTRLAALLHKIRSTWTTSEPEMVGLQPTRFLGMELWKKMDPKTARDVWFMTQEGYTKELVTKDEGLKPRKTPITRDQSQMEPENPVSLEDVRLAQKDVGEALWLATRARPDVMFSVARMGSSVTRSPKAVHLAYQQLKGYLLQSAGEGLKFQVEKDEDPVLTVYTDASFAPDGGTSHGAFVVMLGSCPLFWRSGRQAHVTLSTAESELCEIIEGMIGGESIVVVLEELMPQIIKVLRTDSSSAVSILASDGGSWRTRHLRLRSAFARQAVLNAEWALQHVAGLQMIADIGTKPLASGRIQDLKVLMGMGAINDDSRVKEEKTEGKVEEKSEVRREEKSEEKSEEGGLKISEAAQALRLIILAASISAVRSEGEPEEREIGRSFFEIHRVRVSGVLAEVKVEGSLKNEGKTGEDWSFDAMVIVYTLIVIFATLAVQYLWKVAVPAVWDFAQWCTFSRGSLPGGSEPSQEDQTPQPEAPLPNAPQTNAPLPDPIPEELSAIEEPQPGSSQGSQPESGAVNVQQPETTGYSYQPPRDILQEWDEIEREEAQIRADLNQARPGSHLLGPTGLDQTDPRFPNDFPEVPFPAYTTRLGSVYHLDQNCRHLNAPRVGMSRLSPWCDVCRERRGSRPIPRPGDVIYLTGWGADFHSTPTCTRITPSRVRQLQMCTLCRDTNH